MERDDIWRAIDAQRIALTDLLTDLDDDGWRQPSLCDGWTVRDVAAHLTFAQASLLEMIPAMIRARGSFNRMVHDEAISRAVTPTDELVRTIRGMVGSRKHVVVVTPAEALIDITVHSQDIAVPLGRPLETPPEAAAFAASRVWRAQDRLWPRRRFDGFRLVATDADWSVGEGREVRGPMQALLLVLTGRTAALSRLTGEGASALTGQLAAAG